MLITSNSKCKPAAHANWFSPTFCVPRCVCGESVCLLSACFGIMELCHILFKVRLIRGDSEPLICCHNTDVFILSVTMALLCAGLPRASGAQGWLVNRGVWIEPGSEEQRPDSNRLDCARQAADISFKTSWRETFRLFFFTWTLSSTFIAVCQLSKKKNFTFSLMQCEAPGRCVQTLQPTAQQLGGVSPQHQQ